jgi:hypothetical protein
MKDFILITDDNGAVEIIRKSDLIKVYMVMPDANEVVFHWNDQITGLQKEFRYSPKNLHLTGLTGRACSYFQELSKMLCDAPETHTVLREELSNTRMKSYKSED